MPFIDDDCSCTSHTGCRTTRKVSWFNPLWVIRKIQDFWIDFARLHERIVRTPIANDCNELGTDNVDSAPCGNQMMNTGAENLFGSPIRRFIPATERRRHPWTMWKMSWWKERKRQRKIKKEAELYRRGYLWACRYLLMEHNDVESALNWVQMEIDFGRRSQFETGAQDAIDRLSPLLHSEMFIDNLAMRVEENAEESSE